MCSNKHFISRAAGVGLLSALVAVGLGGQAMAAPMTLSGTYASPKITVSATLMGDFSGNIFTLNNAPPISHLAIDALGSTEPASSMPTKYYSLNCGNFHDCLTISMTPHLVPQLTLSPWSFGVGGVVDFNAATANLTMDPLAPKMIGSLQLVATPVYYVSSSILPDFVTSEISVALNGAGSKITVNASGYWDSVTPGTASAVMSQNGSNVQLDLGLTDSTLNGHLSIDKVDVQLAYDAAQTLANFGVSLFNTTIVEATLGNTLLGLLASQISSLDVNQDGYTQDCTGTPRTTGYIIDTSCVESMNMSLSGVLRPEGVVTEPGMLAIFGLGSLALALAARRRRG